MKKKNKKKAEFIESANDCFGGKVKGLAQEAKRLRRLQDRSYYRGKK